MPRRRRGGKGGRTVSLIQIEHLYFTYDGGSEPVFEDLDLQLDTDWKLGLVGRNGRGKTTLLRLLEGGQEIAHASGRMRITSN